MRLDNRLKGCNKIEFDFISVNIKEFNRNKVCNWIKRVLEIEQHNTCQIQYIFCNDNTLLEINKKYLKHDSLTDIISFNYNEELGIIAGDIFISYERIVENAKTYHVSIRDELHRVIVHGVLHLLGYDDKTLKQKKIMREKENYYLNML